MAATGLIGTIHRGHGRSHTDTPWRLQPLPQTRQTRTDSDMPLALGAVCIATAATMRGLMLNPPESR